jgi:hypothetical protein
VRSECCIVRIRFRIFSQQCLGLPDIGFVVTGAGYNATFPLGNVAGKQSKTSVRFR